MALVSVKNSTSRDELKQMIDRPNLENFDAFNQIFRELGPYLNEFEVDRIVDFMYEIEDSKYDVNPTISDSITQMQLLLGSDRYSEITEQWKQHNQKRISSFGTLKYKCKKTGKLYDGLDDTDDPNDYEKYYV